MTVFLVRHASAGHRDESDPADRLRSLDTAGRRQAQRLMSMLAPHDIGTILSSPAVRCVQTVGPLAVSCDLDIEEVVELAEGADPLAAWALVEGYTGSDADVVLCSHGDLIPDIIRLAQLRGMEVRSKKGCSKGSVWAMHWDGERFDHATYTPVRD